MVASFPTSGGGVVGGVLQPFASEADGGGRRGEARTTQRGLEVGERLRASLRVRRAQRGEAVELPTHAGKLDGGAQPVGGRRRQLGDQLRKLRLAGRRVVLHDLKSARRAVFF